MTQLVLNAFELAIERNVITASDVTPAILAGFLSEHGRAFYGISDPKNERIVLRKGQEIVKESFIGDGVEVVPFRKGLWTWSVEWR